MKSVLLAAGLTTVPLLLNAGALASEGCRVVSPVIEFCGETEGSDYSGWRPWKSNYPNEALWFTYSLGDTSTVLVTDLVSDKNTLTSEQVQLALSAGPKIIEAADRELKTSYKDQVDEQPAETRVYSFKNSGAAMVYVQTWFKTDKALIQIVTVADEEDPSTDWKAVHSAFLAATRYEVN